MAHKGIPADARPSPSPPTSPLAEALATVGDRWTLLAVAALLDGPRRFGDLGRELPGIAPNILSARLRRLEQAGLVVAEPYQERPPRFVYELTAPGRELAGALRLLEGWGGRHREEADSPRHAVCGSPLEARWWCPTCEEALEGAADGDELHFA
ncbi:MAG: helix-turn-helix transcriptional regulator [Thermoleophilaceae bacterium]|nr:helix-turn-helix transcriptional regulator [Thermoleophilaceae bacterium]